MYIPVLGIACIAVIVVLLIACAHLWTRAVRLDEALRQHAIQVETIFSLVQENVRLAKARELG